MTVNAIRRAGEFVALCIIQAIVLNKIHLFDCATPLLLVYFVLTFPRGYPRGGMLLWSFLLGLSTDILTDTPGIAAASMTLVAFIQPYYIELFMPRDAADDLTPSAQTFGKLKYVTYSATLTVLYCLVFYALETFNFLNPLRYIMCVGGSAVLTVLLIFTIESVRK